MKNIKIVLSTEKGGGINVKSKECITNEVVDKMLSIIKEYKISYNDVADILRWLREKIGDTIISDDSLKSD